MARYDREELEQEMEDGYEDYEDEDEYEEEDDGERYEEEEEDPKPTKEALEYLELRQRLKEQIRKKNLKEGGSNIRNNSSDRKRKLSNDTCGSFFGPSQPVISQRVIQESKSFLETQHLNPKVSNPSPNPNKKNTTSSTASGSKPAVHNNKGRVVNEVRNKVQKLKQTRDYSFLLSDEAELPAPTPKPALHRNTSASGSDSRPASTPGTKSKQGGPVNGARHANGERRLSSSNGHANPKPGLSNHRLPSTSRPDSRQSDSRRPHSSNGNGPGRPLGHKAGLPSKASSSSSSVSRSSVPNNNTQRRPQPPASKSQLPSRPQLPSQSRPSSQSQHSSAKSKSQHSSAKSKSQHSLNSRQPPPSASRQNLEQRREYQGSNKPKMIPRPQGGLSRPAQANRPPLKQNLSRHRSGSPVERPKKKPMRRYSDGEDEDENAISMIRQMFRYNPNKFADRDDDLSDMEANFHDIMREEKRSERAGRAEDEEQLLLIQEEEKRERLAKMRKQRRN